MNQPRFARLIYEHGFDEQDAHEARERGYRSHVWVELSDGSRYPVTFFDCIRLEQELKDEVSSGRAFVGEPGLIVLVEVTPENMEGAARTLADEGFFTTPRW